MRVTKLKHLAVSGIAQKGARALSGPAFSDQNKSWLKRKQQQEDGDVSDDLQDHEGDRMLSCWSCVQIQTSQSLALFSVFASDSKCPSSAWLASDWQNPWAFSTSKLSVALLVALLACAFSY